MSTPRYCIGIDLGTSNCSLSWIDTLDLAAGVCSLDIIQWDSESTRFSAKTLPSCLYLPPKAACKDNRYRIPELDPADSDTTVVAGLLARNMLAISPERVIHSAKSWLCHQSADGEADFLPWLSDVVPGNEKCSPVAAMAHLLTHLRRCWDKGPGSGGLSESFARQHIVLTVPASFGEPASRLTMRAAEIAGYPQERLRILEEPQAAFYDWQYSVAGTLAGGHSCDWEGIVRAGARQIYSVSKEVGKTPFMVLVCDIGGGTSDFSLLEIKDQEGLPRAERRFVSDHLLLGGDNIDLHLAAILETRLAGHRLTPRARVALIHEARKIKEKALSSSDDGSQEYHVSVAQEGSSLLGSTLSAVISKEEARDAILSGFFPFCEREPEKVVGSSEGLRDWGLPYARECRITVHLAAFLRGRKVGAVLFAGGSMKPGALQQRILSVLESWQGIAPARISSHNLDLAVSRGAAFAGAAGFFKEGEIRGGYPRNLYIEVARPDGGRSLACILPKGFAAEEAWFRPKTGLRARLGDPVSFRMFQSSRVQEKLGEVLDDFCTRADITPVAGLSTVLAAPEKSAIGKLVDISLGIVLGKTGLLTICCRQDGVAGGNAAGRWDLTFDVKETNQNASEPQEAAALMATGMNPKKRVEIDRIISRYFGKAKKGAAPGNPASIGREIETCLGQPRDQWSLADLRIIWGILKVGQSRRGRSEAHEAAWLSLAGFSLRPGYGAESDRFRVAELWQIFQKNMCYPASAKVRAQWWIMWRRVAGGLERSWQEKIFNKIFPSILKDQATPEIYLLAGAMERLSSSLKARLGQCLIESLLTKKSSAVDQKVLALSRLSSRFPLYGGPETILKPAQVMLWAEALDKIPKGNPGCRMLKYFYAQAGRVLNNADLDLDQQSREKFIKKLSELGAREEMIRGVRGYQPASRDDHQALFGEALPPGLMLGQ